MNLLPQISLYAKIRLPNITALRAARMFKILRLFKGSRGAFETFAVLFDVLLDSAFGLRIVIFFMVGHLSPVTP